MAHTMQIGDDLNRLAEEEALARSAADGDGGAFATLYDRYESAIFNYCHRLVGSGEDAADATQEAFLEVLQRQPKLDEGRDLHFSASLYTAARNASYDMIDRRKRAEPVDEIPEPPSVDADGLAVGALDEDPERSALLASFQEDVRTASARLPDRHREVLALRELDELSYDDIAGIMEMNRNSVAQLISRARIKLRDELRGGALAAVAISSPDCERALPLVSMRQDGQLPDGEDRDWLEAHLAGCDTCRVSVEAIEEAGVSYRAWGPVLPLAWLRQATIERAGELVGADWTEVAGPPCGEESDEARPDHYELEQEPLRHPHEIGRHSAANAPLFVHERQRDLGHDAGETDEDEWEPAAALVDEDERRQKLAALIGGLVLLLVVIGATAFVLGGASGPKDSGPAARKSAAPAPTAEAEGTAAAPEPAPAPAPAKRAKRRRPEAEGGGGTGAAGVGAGATFPTPSGPAVNPEPTKEPADSDKPITTPKEPKPVKRPPTNTTPTPTTPDPTPTTPPAVPTPDPAPTTPPATPPSGGSPPSSVPGGP